MHFKSSGGRPKGKCKGTISAVKLGIQEDNMATSTSQESHVEESVSSGYTFSAAAHYESKPRL